MRSTISCYENLVRTGRLAAHHLHWTWYFILFFIKKGNASKPCAGFANLRTSSRPRSPFIYFIVSAILSLCSLSNIDFWRLNNRVDITSEIAMQGQTGMLLSLHSLISLSFFFFCVFFSIYWLFNCFWWEKIHKSGERMKWRVASKTHDSIFLGFQIYEEKLVLHEALVLIGLWGLCAES